MVPLKVIVGSELAAGILLTHQLENVFVWQVFIVIFTQRLPQRHMWSCLRVLGENLSKRIEEGQIFFFL